MFPILTIINNVAMNIGVHVSFRIRVFFFFFGFITRNEIFAGSHGSSIFSFFEKPQYRFPQRLHQIKFPPTVHHHSLSPHPHQHLLFVVFWITTILIGVR